MHITLKIINMYFMDFLKCLNRLIYSRSLRVIPYFTIYFCKTFLQEKPVAYTSKQNTRNKIL